MRSKQRLVLARIDAVDAAGEDRDRAARKRRLVRGRVDAARQPGDDDELGVAEALGEQRRHLAPGDRGVARADDGDRRARSDAACRRAPRAAAAAHRHGEARADRAARRCRRKRAPSRIVAAISSSASASAGDADGARRAAAPRKVRQRVERGLRRAEMIDEAAERRRPDILAADQPQPGKPLLVGQRDAARAFDDAQRTASAKVGRKHGGAAAGSTRSPLPPACVPPDCGRCASYAVWGDPARKGARWAGETSGSS